MLERIRKEWRKFAAEPPGSRFERHYERKRRDEKTLMGRAMWVAAGLVFVLAGVVMLFTPGPGLLSIGFGVTCLTQESRRLARSCDRVEMQVRRAWLNWRSRRS